jgi:hypothetical protein
MILRRIFAPVLLAVIRSVSATEDISTSASALASTAWITASHPAISYPFAAISSNPAYASDGSVWVTETRTTTICDLQTASAYALNASKSTVYVTESRTTTITVHPSNNALPSKVPSSAVYYNTSRSTIRTNLTVTMTATKQSQKATSEDTPEINSTKMDQPVHLSNFWRHGQANTSTNSLNGIFILPTSNSFTTLERGSKNDSNSFYNSTITVRVQQTVVTTITQLKDPSMTQSQSENKRDVREGLQSQIMHYFFLRSRGHRYRATPSPTFSNPTPAVMTSMSMTTLGYAMLQTRAPEPTFWYSTPPSFLNGTPVPTTVWETWICQGNTSILSCNTDSVYTTWYETSDGIVTPVPSYTCSGLIEELDIVCGDVIYTGTGRMYFVSPVAAEKLINITARPASSTTQPWINWWTLTSSEVTTSTSTSTVWLPTTTEWIWWKQSYFQGQDEQSDSPRSRDTSSLRLIRCFATECLGLLTMTAAFAGMLFVVL